MNYLSPLYNFHDNMKFAIYVVLFQLGSQSVRGCPSPAAGTMSTNMRKEQVVPDVIDQVPRNALQVTYLSGAVQSQGNVLTPTQVKDQPITVKWPTERGAFYTLVMTDPDAPSRAAPTDREFHHWLVVNIPQNRVAEGKTLTEYIGSGPPEGSGLHRYIFLVYKQPGLLIPDEKVITKRTSGGRGPFSVRNFARKYRLGNPIAGNFYQAQYDSYVDELYAQFED